jgi:hypothetical protein
MDNNTNYNRYLDISDDKAQEFVEAVKALSNSDYTIIKNRLRSTAVMSGRRSGKTMQGAFVVAILSIIDKIRRDQV